MLDEFTQLDKMYGPLIKIEKLAENLYNKVNNARNFGGYYSALPDTWRNLTML